MEDALENFVGEEFRVLSYQLVRNELFSAKMHDENDEEAKELQGSVASPITTEEDRIVDPHQKVLFVFGMLEPNCFSLYKDLHLQNMIHSFNRENITFVDLGLSLFNEEKQDKFYFLKMVHRNKHIDRRDVYLMAISASQIQKWDYSLGLQKKPTFIDSQLNTIKSEIFKQMDHRIRNSKQNRQ